MARVTSGQADLKHVMSSSQPLQLHLPAVPELELPATLDQCLQQRRYENLLTLSLRRDSGRQDHALSKEVLALLDGLARVEADSNFDGLGWVLSVVGGERLLNGDSALQSQPSAGEGHHEAVALRLDLETLMGIDLLADDGIVNSQYILGSRVS